MQPQPSPSSGRLWPILAITTIAFTTALLMYFRTRPAAPPSGQSPPVSKSGSPPKQVATPFITPGIRQPPVAKALDAKLADDVEVIGVAVEGFPRAYVIKAFHGTNNHVVNDLLGDIPVTVTYCDLCDTAKVFTDPARGQPLDVKLGGFSEGMLLYAKAVFYHQDTLKPMSIADAPPFPHPTLAFQRLTWKQWRERYPDTEVYISPPAKSES